MNISFMNAGEIYKTTDHRPFDLPAEPWKWFQSWRKLLFAHWQFPAEAIAPLIPKPLELETFDGKAWLAVVPFHLTIRPRYLPAAPWLSRFPEINVRTYVTYQGKPGVWFFSLDARQPLACWAGRKLFYLPYFHANMRMRHRGNEIEYVSDRRRGSARFAGKYKPTSAVYLADPGSLEHWLTERYCLYSCSPDGVIHRADVHHVQWPLQKAEAEININTMTQPIELKLPDEQPLLHYSDRVDVLGWPIESLHLD